MTTDLARLLVRQEIEDFLYHEAELLDERRYEEWLALFTATSSAEALTIWTFETM
jgi:3-phenylpropionate/cinnamic acid dioxygenase small subunit